MLGLELVVPSVSLAQEQGGLPGTGDQVLQEINNNLPASGVVDSGVDSGITSFLKGFIPGAGCVNGGDIANIAQGAIGGAVKDGVSAVLAKVGGVEGAKKYAQDQLRGLFKTEIKQDISQSSVVNTAQSQASSDALDKASTDFANKAVEETETAGTSGSVAVGQFMTEDASQTADTVASNVGSYADEVFDYGGTEVVDTAGVITGIPVHDLLLSISESVAHAKTDTILTKILGENTKTEKDVAALVKKEYCLDSIATALERQVIRLAHDMVIRWILTGNFGAPQFVQSFTADPKKIAENAARIFVSQITGINFCNYFPPIVGPALFSNNISISLACNVANPQLALYTQFYSPYTGNYPISDWIAAQSPNRDYVQTVINAQDAKAAYETAAVNAWRTQTIANNGFYGQQNANGSIVTPGSIVAEPLKSLIQSNDRQRDLVNEIGQAIASIVNTAVGQMINKGLGNIFQR
ncbi:MAG: hypothetical protein HY220_01510 [Candidatus Sungbacteria bacterium]|uniref:Uncharacterized protein n=1 Tax=Candidatus Sungiibacteriota bacterium TaxID=2750080 RepID=A0A9D6QVG2_9BACT|nr:hypothetical protein [Candidatus Sungbacteria bacterium]